MKLMEKYPRLYNISNQKNCCILEVGNWTEGIWRWELSWIRALRDFELNVLNLTISTLRPPKLQGNDSWTWSASDDGLYSVSSAYSIIRAPSISSEDEVLQSLWSTPAPPNVAALAWRVLIDRVQSRSNLLIRRVLHTVEEACCPLCLRQLETTSHLFFSCQVSWRIWMGCYNWLGLDTVLPEDGRQHFSQHILLWSKKQRQGAWIVWIAAIWTIGNIRNGCIFRGERADLEKTLDLILFRS